MSDCVTELFHIERVDQAIVFVPKCDMSVLAFEQNEAKASATLASLDKLGGTNVIVDFDHTDFFGSSALGFFVKLWQWVRQHDGRMAFCNLSDHEKEILHITKMDSLWSICSSRSEALTVIHGRAGQSG